MTNELPKCYTCKNMRRVPGNCHIECLRPDPDMYSDSYPKRMGWFFYPFVFDPIWMEKECCNFEVK